MKSIIKLAGRFSVLALSAILCEGLFTSGNAFHFESYGVLGWIVQSLILILCMWGAIEWHEEVEEQTHQDVHYLEK